MPPPFRSPYTHGFVRAAIATPVVALGSPRDNAAEMAQLLARTSSQRAGLVLFPELGISGYSNEDLFFQDALLSEVETALAELAAASRTLGSIIVVGAPIRREGKLFNCALILYRGAILGIVPKAYLPNYREFYERRQFSSAAHAMRSSVSLLNQEVPFGTNLIFDACDCPGFSLHVEICEDLWVPIPPSSVAAMAGAIVLANLSASNATIGKADYRRLLCAAQSGRCVAAYLYAGAGFGESTTDLAWDGHALVCENGDIIAEGERFGTTSRLLVSDIDLDRLIQERSRLTSFGDCAQAHRDAISGMRRIPFAFEPPPGEFPLVRPLARFPYVPTEKRRRDERCREVYEIQVQGLAQRLRATRIQKTVIGVSGGVDSAQALLVAARAFDRLGLPRGNILAYSLPGFATSRRTQENALQLMRSLGVSASEIDIRPAARQMLADINHPFAHGEAVYDTTFENVQAGARTSLLFRLANRHNALVIGTSDLSELALGYTTYGVGDHMAHYSVNASVPKTLVRHLVRWVIGAGEFAADARAALEAILDVPASPELVPLTTGQFQRAEDEIGPYELHDFYLYYLSRYGYRPAKIAFLAWQAWEDRERGDWPETIPPAERHAYDLATIKRWLEVFLFRFIEFSQFKRSALPNGPKVGSGGSLSPRSDWRAPSDVSAKAWLEELRRSVP